MPGKLQLPKSTSKDTNFEHLKYEFQFVEVGKSFKARDTGARSIVRAHVMRDFYSKKRDSRRQFSQPKDSRQAGSHRFKVGRFGLQELGKKPKGGKKGPPGPPVKSVYKSTSAQPANSKFQLRSVAQEPKFIQHEKTYDQSVNNVAARSESSSTVAVANSYKPEISQQASAITYVILRLRLCSTLDVSHS